MSETRPDPEIPRTERDRDEPATPHSGVSHRKTWRIAGILSVLLIFSWAAYVGLAPQPQTQRGPSETPSEALSGAQKSPSPQQTAATRPLTLIAPRRLIDSTLLAEFEQNTGQKVRLVTYADEDQFRTNAISQAPAADVVLTSGPNIRALIEADRLQILPLHRIDAATSLDPGMISRTIQYDPGRFHALPFAWLTIGIGYHRSAVRERLGADADLATWGVVFDPSSAARLASCGLQSIDAPAPAFTAALAYLRRSPAASGVADIEAAASLWDGVKGFFTKFDSRDIANSMADGKICAAIAPSVDIYQARAITRANGSATGIEFVVPREGAILRIYFLGIPAPSDRVEMASELVSYLLRPDIAAAMTNSKWAANAVPRSRNFLRPEVQDDVFIYPDAAVMSRLTLESPLAESDSGLRARLWRMINAPPLKP